MKIPPSCSQARPRRADRRAASGAASRAALTTALAWLLLQAGANAATNDTTSFWDRGLLGLKLGHVDLKAASLFDAWDDLGRGYLVRTVMVAGPGAGSKAPFEFASETCTVADVIGAMLAAYPDYRLTQDPDTGILWVHPVSVPYESILPAKVAIPPGMEQVPMLQGVLRQLEPQGAFRVYQNGAVQVFENAAAYPVTLRPGVFTVRDVVNMCCQASPSRTFGVTGGSLISAGDILDDTPRRVARPGSLLFWRLGMGRAGDAEPTGAELLEALASRNAHERWVARSFIKAETFHVPIQHIIMEAPPGRKAVWASLGMLTMHNLTAPTTNSPGLLRMRREMSRDTAASLDRGTVVLAAMEMARAGDDALLKKVAQWNLGPDELAAIYPDGIRLARLSSIVRAALKEANCAWPGLSAKEVRDMEEQTVLLVPK
jgi:hypothetical protein